MRSNQEAHKHSVLEGGKEEQATVDEVAGREEAKKGMRTRATVGEDEVMRRKKVGRKEGRERWDDGKKVPSFGTKWKLRKCRILAESLSLD